ncbi:MAG: hypothetical protein HOG49_35265 [Candidatus Scalindua sp.]|nr:hypothetical protein [Candidatus Scalindua sp.]
MKENLGKYLLYTLLGIIVLVIIVGAYPFVTYVLADKEKNLSSEIPYFNVNIKMKHVSNNNGIDDYFKNEGETDYIIYFEGHTDKYDYNNYNGDEGLYLNFRDEDGFQVFKLDRPFGDMTRIKTEGEIVGFQFSGSLESYKLNFNDFKRIDHLEATWYCDFPER